MPHIVCRQGNANENKEAALRAYRNDQSPEPWERQTLAEPWSHRTPLAVGVHAGLSSHLEGSPGVLFETKYARANAPATLLGINPNWSKAHVHAKTCI